MIPLLTLRDTLDAFAACNDDGHVHEAFGWVHATGEDPLQARFWLPPDEATAFGDDDTPPAAARAVGVGAGVFASFDLVLARCPPECVKPIAQQVAHLLDWPIGQALAACRAGSLTVGEALDGLRAAAIAADFAALGVPLQVQGYKAFPWMPVPTLA
ncbi:hypothetical protein [Xanthomonas sp. LF06-19]|uniref:hypothetical protein n=1 Tax=Xanthomonas sp. LF06-19 TaxID=3097551 RepID=UPI002A83AB68|nr:hypothetical protein [Xanthomonas sp. LF06-19]MDY4282257.1 hypothetical protein [Xanthomonas sp. LF06-19]